MKVARICDYPECDEVATGRCEQHDCGNSFCSDHGSRGGDRETEGGLVAVASQCWNCGGFNADE